jgi:V/A-type H+-transporting ATPase subunit I
MLTPEQMSRLLIVASRDQMRPVITELYRRHLFHIEDFVDSASGDYAGFRIGTPLAGANEASGDLVKVRAMENVLSIHGEDVEPAGKQSSSEFQARIEHELPGLEHEIEALTGRRLKLETKVKECEQKIAEIAPFGGIPLDLELYRGYRNFTVFAGTVTREVPLTVPNETFGTKIKDRHFVVVVTPNEHRGEAEKALQGAGFQSVPIPEETGAPQERIDFYTAQIAETGKEIDEINRKLDVLKRDNTGFLVACEEVLKAEIERTEAPLRFATTNETFVAEGWVPAKSVAEVSGALEKATGGRIFVTEVPVDPDHDAVPVEYNNPRFARPTQMLMDIYSRPTYTEVDPTLMVSIVFPLFFGLILGDVGYGLVLLAMVILLHRIFKGEEGQQLLTTLRNASVSTIFFGLLFSEFLGFELPWKPILFSRHLNIGGEAGAAGPAIPELMIMAIWIGILHITLGRVLGMVNHARQDHGAHRMKAVLANFGWIAVMWGILVAIWSVFAMPYMPDLSKLPVIGAGVPLGTIIGAILIALGLALIARDAVLEIVEIPTILSHVLSYARIVAVGLSSVAIAMVINYMAIGLFIGPQLKNISILGIFIIIAGVLVFIVGHLLNTALGILGGGLHSIRLHYVEFFTKFYKGGGIKYNPFGMKRRFTED